MPIDVRNSIVSMVQRIEEYVQDISEEDIPFLTVDVLQSQLDSVRSLLARYETHQASVIASQILKVDTIQEVSAIAAFQHRCITLCDRIEQLRDRLIPKPQSARESSTFLMAFDDDIREFMQHREEQLHHLLALSQTASSSSKNSKYVESEFSAHSGDLPQINQLEVASSAPIATQRQHNAPSESLSATKAIHVSAQTYPLMHYTLNQSESEPRAQGGIDCDNESTLLRSRSASLHSLHALDASASLTKPIPAPRTRPLDPIPPSSLTTIHQPATSCLCCQESPHPLHRCSTFLSQCANEELKSTRKLPKLQGRQPHHQNERTTSKCTRCQEGHQVSFQEVEDEVFANLPAPLSSSSITVSAQSSPVVDVPPPNLPLRKTALLSVSKASASRSHYSRPGGQLAASEVMSHSAVDLGVSCHVVSDKPEVCNAVTTSDSGLGSPNLPSDHNLGIGNNLEQVKFRDSPTSSERTCLPVNPDYLIPETSARFPRLAMDAKYQPLAIVHPDNLQAMRRNSYELQLQETSYVRCAMEDSDVDKGSSSLHGTSQELDVVGEHILLPQLVFVQHDASPPLDDALFEFPHLMDPENPSILQDSPPGENHTSEVFDFDERSSSFCGTISGPAIVREHSSFSQILSVHCNATIPLHDGALLGVRTFDSPKNSGVVSRGLPEDLKDFTERRMKKPSLIGSLLLLRHSGLSSFRALPNTMTSELLPIPGFESTYYSMPDDSESADLMNTSDLSRSGKVLTVFAGLIPRETGPGNLALLRVHPLPNLPCKLKWDLDCPGPPITCGKWGSLEVLLNNLGDFGTFVCSNVRTPILLHVRILRMCVYPFQRNESEEFANPIGLRGLPDQPAESLCEINSSDDDSLAAKDPTERKDFHIDPGDIHHWIDNTLLWTFTTRRWITIILSWIFVFRRWTHRISLEPTSGSSHPLHPCE